MRTKLHMRFLRRVGFMRNVQTKHNKVYFGNKCYFVTKKGNSRFFFDLRQEKLWLGRQFTNLIKNGSGKDNLNMWNVPTGSWATAKDGKSIIGNENLFLGEHLVFICSNAASLKMQEINLVQDFDENYLVTLPQILYN